MSEGVKIHKDLEKMLVKVELLVSDICREADIAEAQRLKLAAVSGYANLSEGIKLEPNIEAVKFFFQAQASIRECGALVKVLKKKKCVKENDFVKTMEELTKIESKLGALIKTFMLVFNK